MRDMEVLIVLATCIAYFTIIIKCIQNALKNGETFIGYEQQGWEKMNSTDRNFIARHTSQGAEAGRKRKEGPQKRPLEGEADQRILTSNKRPKIGEEQEEEGMNTTCFGIGE